jgi:hypothetical protein
VHQFLLQHGQMICPGAVHGVEQRAK